MGKKGRRYTEEETAHKKKQAQEKKAKCEAWCRKSVERTNARNRFPFAIDILHKFSEKNTHT